MKAKRDERLNRISRYADLIERQTGKAVRPFRLDGYANLLNRYGTSKDTTEQYHYEPEPAVPDDLITMFYESNGLFATIIDTPAEEAIKHGFTLEGLSDSKIEDFYRSALDELDWEETAMTAIKWARLFGGSIAVMLINDGRGLEEPLDWRHIQSIDDIRVYDRSVITPDYSSMYAYNPSEDPFRTRGSRLGMPEWYDVYSRTGSFRVHDSRCLVFQNGALPENTSNSNYQYWGVPEYVRLHRAIRDTEVAHGSAVKLLDRSVQAVYKMKDLASLLATEEGETSVLKRLQVIDMARGLLNSIVIDQEGEEYDFRTFNYSGVSEVINTTCNYLSALTNIPQTILFGRSPAGMNSTGEGDLENYYNFIERIERRMVRKNLRYLLSVIFQAGVATGEIDEVPPIKIKFNPLWNISEADELALKQQKLDLEQARAQTAQLYVDMQVISPKEVRRKLADSGEFDVETMLDEYTPEELEANAPKGEGEEGGAPGEVPVPEEPAISSPDGTSGEMPPTGEMPEGKAPEGNVPDDAVPGKKSAEEEQEESGEALPVDAEQPPEEKKPQESGSLPDGIIKKGESPVQVSVSPKKGKPEAGGNAPDAAPTATKLPDDMSVQEKESIEENTGKKPEKQVKPEKPSAGEKETFTVSVLVVKDGKVLTATRNNDTGYGLIGCPGGHGETGETPKEAAVRETKEEFGITPKDLLYIGKGREDEETGQAPSVFLCTDYDGDVECLDTELANPKFRSLKELRAKPKKLFGPLAGALDLMEKVLSSKPDAGHYEPEAVESTVEEIRGKRLSKATGQAQTPEGKPKRPRGGAENASEGTPERKNAKTRWKQKTPPETPEKPERGPENDPGQKQEARPGRRKKPGQKPPAEGREKPSVGGSERGNINTRGRGKTTPGEPESGNSEGKKAARKQGAELSPELLRQVREVADAIHAGMTPEEKQEASGDRLSQKEIDAIADVIAIIRGGDRKAMPEALKREITDVVSEMRREY